jgi:hypothetical protein
MTTNATPPEDRDAAWLEALAGRPPPLMDEGDRVEAGRLRRVLLNRRKGAFSEIVEPSEVDFLRLWSHLSEEQPRPPEVERFELKIPPHSSTSMSSKSESRLPSNSPVFIWSLAASLLLATGLIVSIGPMDGILSGSPAVTTRNAIDESKVISETEYRRMSVNSTHVLIEAINPEAEYLSLSAEARRLRVDISVAKKNFDEYEITIPATLAGTELIALLTMPAPNPNAPPRIRILKLKQK